MKNTVRYWLISRHFLWTKKVFDNGVAGNNYHRYDHKLFSYSQGMGDNGKHGDVSKAIKWQLEAYQKQIERNEKKGKSLLCLLGFHKYYEKDGQGYMTDGQCRRKGCFNFK